MEHVNGGHTWVGRGRNTTTASAISPAFLPPVGSRVRVMSRGSTLTLAIPGVGLFGRGSRLPLTFLFIWALHASFLTYAFWPGGHVSWSRVVMISAVWIFGLLLAAQAAFWMFGHTSIAVGPRGVTIGRRIGAWHYQRVAPMAEWNGAVCRQMLRRGSPNSALVLCIGTDDVRVEVPLSRTEQEWLAALLNNWMSAFCR